MEFSIPLHKAFDYIQNHHFTVAGYDRNIVERAVKMQNKRQPVSDMQGCRNAVPDWSLYLSLLPQGK